MSDRLRTGLTPLLLCCEHGQGAASCEGVRLLVRANAPLDPKRKLDGGGAAHMCAEAGCPRCLHLLLTKEPKLIDARDRQHRTPLHVAAACRKPDAPLCVALLLSEGAQLEPCTAGTLGLARPLHLACLTG